MPFVQPFLMAAPAEGSNPMLSFLPLILIFVVFYFLLIRPQRKKEAERKRMVAAVRKGDKVVTIGGLHGKVVQVDDASVLIEADTNVKLRIEKSALASVDTKG